MQRWAVVYKEQTIGCVRATTEAGARKEAKRQFVFTAPFHVSKII